jgi:hypothetical protein
VHCSSGWVTRAPMLEVRVDSWSSWRAAAPLRVSRFRHQQTWCLAFPAGPQVGCRSGARNDTVLLSYYT